MPEAFKNTNPNCLMFIKTVHLSPKKFIGKQIQMSLSNNRTAELWKDFMSNRSKISNAISTDLYSLQIYKPDYFKNFSPQTEFTKWALTEVEDFSDIPIGFEAFELTAGLYAVFLHKGDTSAFIKTFEFIFQEWLPKSGFQLDDRPHFELLTDTYKNNSSESEEEVWIPIL
jgi:AraC family transcriptional regulator